MRRTNWVIAGLAVTAAVVGVVIGNSGDLADQVGEPLLARNGTIVYEANGNIRKVNPDGSDDGRVIGAFNDRIGQTCPRYSPDGLWLLHEQWMLGGLVGDPALGKIGLIRSRVDGQGRPSPTAEPLITIASSHSGVCGQWSSAGQAFATFRVGDNGDMDLAIVSIDERTVEFLPASTSSASIDWSPSGDFLACSTGNGLAIADISTGDVSVVTTSATPEELSWSPDGQRFAYTGVTEGDRNDLFLINRDGTNEIRVTQGDEWESSPSWSPRGELAIVQTDCGQFECRAHAALYQDGGLTLLPQPLIEDTRRTDVQGPLVWSPDGALILHRAFVPNGEWRQPLVATPTFGLPRVVTVEAGITSYDWQRR